MRFALCGVALIGLTLSGCSALTPRPAEEVVAERAQQWMDAMIAVDYDAAWEFVAPGYKQQWDIGHYRARYRGAGWWLEGEMGPVSCEGDPADSCEVILYITYQAPMIDMANRKTFVTKWLKTDGKWLKFEQ